MKRQKFCKTDIISVYKFMEKCGLHCEPKGNISISHKIMMNKLYKRHESFEQVIVPSRAFVDSIRQEDVISGKVIFVRDDYNKVIPYRMPIYSLQIEHKTKEEMKKIREKLIKEQLEKEKSSLKPGYINYLIRRENKNELLEEKMESEEIFYEITEKIGRVKKLEKRKIRY